MKIMKESPNKSNFTIQNILGQSLWYARCSQLSISLMSGLGIPYSKNDLENRIGLWRKDNIISGDIPDNINLLQAIYKKGDPKYTDTFNGNEKDYANYKWDSTKFTRNITPAAQAYLIINEAILGKYLHNCLEASGFENTENKEEKRVLAYLLINSAIIQADFAAANLRNHNGLFIEKEDVSKETYEEISLLDEEREPETSEQALFMEAFSTLSSTLQDESYPLFSNVELSNTFSSYANEIYNMFHESQEELFTAKTRDLSNTILSLIKYYDLNKNNDVWEFILHLSLELESRVDMSGNLIRYPNENRFTSSPSCFTAINALIESYKLTDIYKFLNCAELIYTRLNLLWDDSNNLYFLDNNEKFEYTLRDIGSVISGLNSIRTCSQSSFSNDAEKKLIKFFNAALNESGMVLSTLSPPESNDCEVYMDYLRSPDGQINPLSYRHPSIRSSLEINTAPVFAKKFKLKYKKHKYTLSRNSMYSDYTLYTINKLLQTALTK